MTTMGKKSSVLAVVQLCVACGASDSFEGQLDIGQAEQAFSAKSGPTYQLGTTTSSAHLACNKTSSGQVCSVPDVPFVQGMKYMNWAFNPGDGFTTDQRNKFRLMLQSFDNTLSSWGFNEDTTFFDPRVLVDRASCSGSASSNNIESFSCVDLYVDNADLVEGSGVVGQYKTHMYAGIHIDIADIEAKFSAQIDRDNLLMHAFGHGILTFLGLGSRSDSGAAGYVSRRVVNTSQTNFPLTTGEDCKLESYNATRDGQFAITTPACASD